MTEATGAPPRRDLRIPQAILRNATKCPSPKSFEPPATNEQQVGPDSVDVLTERRAHRARECMHFGAGGKPFGQDELF